MSIHFFGALQGYKRYTYNYSFYFRNSFRQRALWSPGIKVMTCTYHRGDGFKTWPNHFLTRYVKEMIKRKQITFMIDR